MFTQYYINDYSHVILQSGIPVWSQNGGWQENTSYWPQGWEARAGSGMAENPEYNPETQADGNAGRAICQDGEIQVNGSPSKYIMDRTLYHFVLII